MLSKASVTYSDYMCMYWHAHTGASLLCVLRILFRRYPVMWQGHLTLKNESAAVQLHFLSGNVQLAKSSLPGSGEGRSPALRIAQRMRLEPTQLEGVQRRMQVWHVHTVYILNLFCWKWLSLLKPTWSCSVFYNCYRMN